MLPQDIQCPIAISINQPLLSGTVQSTLDAFATEFIGLRVVCIPDGENIAIQRTVFI
jgi:hypothetical protein